MQVGACRTTASRNDAGDPPSTGTAAASISRLHCTHHGGMGVGWWTVSLRPRTTRNTFSGPLPPREFPPDLLDRWFGSTRLAFCHMSWTVAEAGASSAMLLVYHNVFHVGWFCPAPRSPLDLPPLGLFSDRSGSHPHLTRLALPIEPAILSLLFPFVPRRGSRLLSPIDPRRARVRMRHPRGGLHPLWEAPHRRTSHFFIVFGFFGA